LPPTHVWPPVHWWPHVPQLSRSLLRLVSQPLAAKLSQSPNPGLQLKPHVLATHFAPVTYEDIQSEAFRDGHITDNNLSVTGGNDRTAFFLSGGYNANNGVFVGPIEPSEVDALVSFIRGGANVPPVLPPKASKGDVANGGRDEHELARKTQHRDVAARAECDRERRGDE